MMREFIKKLARLVLLVVALPVVMLAALLDMAVVALCNLRQRLWQNYE
jgi:hypothetical protein